MYPNKVLLKAWLHGHRSNIDSANIQQHGLYKNILSHKASPATHSSVTALKNIFVSNTIKHYFNKTQSWNQFKSGNFLITTPNTYKTIQ